MKQFILVFSLVFIYTFSSNAQKLRDIDKTPLDMAYYPDNFNHDRKFDPKPEWNDKALIRVIYSRPFKNNRVVFGNLVPYGKVWRTGANESTEIKFYENATIMGKVIPAGTYSMFTIPNEKSITIIFNKELDQFGHYSYKQELDVLRVDVPMNEQAESIENFTIQFNQVDDLVKNASMILAWDTTVVVLPITF